jgi:hypothetical protein
MRVASTEKPTAQEVVFKWGEVSSAKRNYMYPYISAGVSTFNSSWVLLDESITETTDADITIGTTKITVKGTIAKGYSITSDYYKYWVIKNSNVATAFKAYCFIISSTYSTTDGGTIEFNTLENPTAMSWLADQTFVISRWFHNNVGIDLTYQTYPSVTTREGEFRVSGGKGSGTGDKPIWAGYINRVFFPGNAKTFTYKGTYVSERSVKAPTSTDMTVTQTLDSISGSLVALETGYTYWVGVSVVYDGYQHSPIYAGENEYLSLSGSYYIVKPFVYGGSLNKRITSVNVFIAQDKGDTTTTGRVNPYYLVKELDLTSTENTWTYTADAGSFNATINLDKTVWDNRTNEWSTLSGYTEGVATIHSYDQEINALGRQFIARVYNDTATQDDLDRVYTNPTSGDGLVQPDIFPLEPDVFVGRAQWGDSSYITGLVETERGRILVLKDRAVIDLGVEIDNDGTCRYRPLIVSTQDGCVSPNTGFIKTPYGIYFAGYNDFYVLEGLQLKALARDDWGDTYSALATSDKQAAILWYRDDEKAIFAQFDSASNGFAFYLSTKDWRQFEYVHQLLDYTTKRDGTVIWLGDARYKFDANGTVGSTDLNTGIWAQWDTGKTRLFETDKEGFLNKVWVWKQVVASSGTLKCDLLLTTNGSLNEIELTGLTKSDKRLLLSPLSTDNKCFDYVQVQYNTADLLVREVGAVEFSDIEIDYSVRKKARTA